MADHIDQTIQDGCAEVDRLAAELVQKKKTVNSICEMFGRPAVYQDVSAPETSRFASQGRVDRYHNKALATVLKLILSARNAAGIGPATIDELYAEMQAGSFDFGGKSADDSKRGLAVSLSKNSKMFYRVKEGIWGLPEWYGIKPGRGATQKTLANGESHTEGEDPDPEAKAQEFGEADQPAEVPAKG